MRTAREAAVFVRRGQEFLLMHRAVDRYWHVAAGGVEEGEEFAEAAARELREETGLETRLVPLDLPRSYTIPAELRAEYAPGVREVSIQNFAAEAPAGWAPVLNEEHDDYRWCSVSDAVALAHWPETVEVIAALARPSAAPP